MYWFILFAGMIALGIYVAHYLWCEWLGYVGWVALWLVLGGIIGTFLAVPFGLAVEDSITYKSEQIGYQEIVAMKDNISIEGSRWYIHTDNKYYVMVESEEGLSQQTYDSEDVYIKCGDIPGIRTYRRIPQSNFWTFFFGKGWFTKTYYVVYVPEGSVTTDFNVDLE